MSKNVNTKVHIDTRQVLTFKDLKERFSLEAAQDQSKLIERLQNKTKL
jgi:hypothetical protein